MINRLINGIYFDKMLEEIYSLRTTDAFYNFTIHTPMMEIAIKLLLCSYSQINFFAADKEKLEELLSNQDNLFLIEQEMINHCYYRFQTRRGEEISRINGPTTFRIRVDLPIEDKLEKMGIESYLQDRNLDILFFYIQNIIK